jgi:hypothetical protein
MAFESEGGDGGGAADLLGGAAGGDDGGAGGGADGGQGGGSGGGEGGGEGFQAPDWFEKLSAETGEGETASNRDWAQAAGVKDLDGLVKLARDNQRAARDKAGVKVPGEGAKPEEITAFRTAIGVPEKADGYKLPQIENGKFDPSRAEGPDNLKHVPLDEAVIGRLRESAHAHGAPAAAFEGMVKDFVMLQLEEQAAATKAGDEEAAAKLKEWGGAKAENLANVDSAARALGLSRADMSGLRSALGAGRALDLLAKLGGGMSEDTLISGGRGRFGVSGAEAKAELDRMKADPELAKKILVAGTPERIRYDRLNAAAAEWQAAQDQAA